MKNYNIEILFLQGKVNITANALSRKVIPKMKKGQSIEDRGCLYDYRNDQEALDKSQCFVM